MVFNIKKAQAKKDKVGNIRRKKKLFEINISDAIKGLKVQANK